MHLDTTIHLARVRQAEILRDAVIARRRPRRRRHQEATNR
jgi:hypothetical protein